MKLADLFIKLGLKKEGFDKGLEDSKRKTNLFTKGIKKLGGTIAGVFAVDRLLAFGKEILNLSGAVDGVEKAFYRIADADVLGKLKEATKGTVSEFDLMRRAVYAQQLGLPVENLANLLQFATKRAQETGQSVDYLVDSIVTGIGRKSVLILDNLGISTVQLNEKLNGLKIGAASVGEVAKAVGDIAQESMKETGDIIDNNTVKLQGLSARWDDFKAKLAKSTVVTKVIGGALEQLNADLDLANSELPWIEKAFYRLTFQHKKGAERAREYDAALQAQNQTTTKATETTSEFSNLLEEVNVSAEENNKIWEKKRKLWAEQSKEAEKQRDVMWGIVDAFNAYKKALPSGNEKLLADMPDVSGIVGGNGVFEMFEEEQGIGGFDFDPSNTLTSLDAYFDAISLGFERNRTELLGATRQLQQDINDSFEYLLEDVAGSFAADLGEAIAGGDWSDFGKGVLEVIGRFMQQLGALLIAYAINMGLFAEAAKNPLSWPVALAAGVAMVAAGAAITAFSSKGLSSGATSSAYAGASGYSPSASSAITPFDGNVKFILEGDKLVGAINNNNSKRRLTR